MSKCSNFIFRRSDDMCDPSVVFRSLEFPIWPNYSNLAKTRAQSGQIIAIQFSTSSEEVGGQCNQERD